VTGETLLRFYVLHIYVIPAAIFLLLGIHIWRVRKDGFAADDSDRIAARVVDVSAEAPGSEVNDGDARI
jgi:quinol-cytochrome oxidoreductase complex cytochrome b subunit